MSPLCWKHCSGLDASMWEHSMPMPKAGSREGPANPLVQLFREIQPGLFRYLICLGVRREAADDVIQEAFLRLHQEQKSGVQIGNARAWVYQVSHNLAVSLD